MLTDTFGAPARNAGDTVVKIALAMLRLGDCSSDLQRQPYYPRDLVAPLRGGRAIIVNVVANKLLTFNLVSK